MPTRGFARRALVLSFLVAAGAWLAGCAPVPASQDAWSSSGGGGGGGGGGARAGWVSETHETPRPELRETTSRAPSRMDDVDLRPPRMGIIYCRKCQ